MTTLLAWASAAQQTAILLADDQVSGSPPRGDKIQLVHGRWGIGIYGSSLLKWTVDDLGYFNDRTKRPAIRSIAGLVALLGRLAQMTLPTRLRWLAQAGLSRCQIEAFLEAPSGYVLLDTANVGLWHIHLRRARDLPDVRPDADVRKCEEDRLWLFGQMQDGVGIRSETPRGGLQPKDLRRELRAIARAHPEYVGKPGSMVTVQRGRVSVSSIWRTVEEYVSDQMASDPLYLRDL